jgi:hypothetical protein
VLLSALGKVQGMTKELANNHGQRHQVFFAVAQPCERFFFLIRHETLYLNRYKMQAKIPCLATYLLSRDDRQSSLNCLRAFKDGGQHIQAFFRESAWQLNFAVKITSFL